MTDASPVVRTPLDHREGSFLKPAASQRRTQSEAASGIPSIPNVAVLWTGKACLGVVESFGCLGIPRVRPLRKFASCSVVGMSSDQVRQHSAFTLKKPSRAVVPWNPDHCAQVSMNQQQLLYASRIIATG
jgi:hypothetical protein